MTPRDAASAPALQAVHLLLQDDYSPLPLLQALLQDDRPAAQLLDPLAPDTLMGPLIDREAVAERIGFATITANSLDAVADRDDPVEVVARARIHQREAVGIHRHRALDDVAGGEVGQDALAGRRVQEVDRLVVRAEYHPGAVVALEDVDLRGPALDVRNAQMTVRARGLAAERA